MSLLNASGVNKSFGGLKALREVNFQVDPGQVHAIIGPNGAGKSTFMNCIIGKLRPDSGQVVFNGQQLLDMQPHTIAQTGISRVFQTPEIFDGLNLLENVMIPAFSKRDGTFKFNFWNAALDQRDIREKSLAVLDEVGLVDQRDALAENLSRGDKRRLEMAMCLVQDPKLLLLDEPTAGMSRADTNNTIELLQQVGKDRGLTKVIIEHDMHVVFSLAHKISVLAQGAIIADGKPEEIKGNSKVQEAYLGGSHTHGDGTENTSDSASSKPVATPVTEAATSKTTHSKAVTEDAAPAKKAAAEKSTKSTAAPKTSAQKASVKKAPAKTAAKKATATKTTATKTAASKTAAAKAGTAKKTTAKKAAAKEPATKAKGDEA